MPRISSWLLSLAFLAPVLSYAQANQTIDINLASITELQKLPGVTTEIANKIKTGRPYAKAVDLLSTGLTEAQIHKIEPLITFGQRQKEAPGGQGGAVASATHEIPASQNTVSAFHGTGADASFGALHLCPPLIARAQSTQALWVPTKENEATAYIPANWFTQDGNNFTQAGETGFHSLFKTGDKASDKHFAIVEVQPENPRREDKDWAHATEMLVFRALNYETTSHSVQTLPSAKLGPAWATESNNDETGCGRTAVDWSNAISGHDVKGVTLVLLPKKD